MIESVIFFILTSLTIISYLLWDAHKEFKKELTHLRERARIYYEYAEITQKPVNRLLGDDDDLVIEMAQSLEKDRDLFIKGESDDQ